MRIPWVIVSNTGYDAEEVVNPRTVEMQCPACERYVRFVEKELIKNLRVFGVSIIGVEKGRRVFECPNCKVCIDSTDGDATPVAVEKAPDVAATIKPQVDALEARIKRASDEAWLWGQRAKTAAEKGARDLEFDATSWRDKAERELEKLKETLSALRASVTDSLAPERRATEAGPTTFDDGPVVGKSPEQADRDTDAEFAAFRAKLAKRRASDLSADEPKSSSATLTSSETRRMAETPKDERAVSAASDAVQTPPVASRDSTLDADFAALKARMAGQSAAPLPMAENQPSGEPATSEASAAEPSGAAQESAKDGADETEGDPTAVLKRRLRKGST